MKEPAPAPQRDDRPGLDVELITDRGHRLRAWRGGDADAVRAAFDDAAMATQIEGPLVDVAAGRAWVDERRAQWLEGRAYSWAVVDGGDVLGSVTLSSIDRRHDTGWISYWTVAAARGRGVAASALRALSTWAFDELGLFRLELGHRTNNPASRRVAVAAGFLAEGRQRERLRFGDERFDVELHARLASDPAPVR